MIRQNLIKAQTRQKNQADQKRRDLRFEPGESVYLKIAPWKATMRGLRKRGKLAPRYIGPFPITGKVGPVAYRLKLPEEMGGVHDVFHVSNLRRNMNQHQQFILPKSPEDLRVDLTYEVAPLRILQKEVRKLRSRTIPMVKVQWKGHSEEEAT